MKSFLLIIIIICCIYLFFITYIFAADLNFTGNTYRLGVPDKNYENWHTPVNANFTTIDNVMTIVSNDMSSTSTKVLISRDAVTTVGGQVGRIRVISADGTASYIRIYAGQ